MIRHIVLIKFYPAVGADERRAAISMLRNLGNKIPEIREWYIGERAEPATPTNYDVAEIASFDDHNALERFRAHPVHREVTEVMKNIADWIVVDCNI